MTAEAVLATILEAGGQVIPDPDRPRLLVPPALKPLVLDHREVLRELLRRAAIFRQQAARFLQEGRALPLLLLPEHPGADGCLSCGATVAAGSFRCPLCALAVQLALDVLPLSPLHQEDGKNA